MAPSVSGSAQSLTVIADHLGAFLAGEQRGDGAVDAAGHGDGDAAVGREGPRSVARLGRLLREVAIPPSGRDQVQGRRRDALEGSVEGVGGELGGVALGGGEAADGGVDGVDVEQGGVENGRAVDHLGDRGGGGLGGAAALGVEGDALDPPVGDRERDPREIAAGSPTRSAREGALEQPARAGSHRSGSARRAPYPSHEG